MAWINRLLSMVDGPGIPFQNDVLFQSVGNALGTSNTTSLTGLTPTVSKGMIRVKVYGGLTSPTLTALNVVLSDGVDFVQVFAWAGTITLSATPAGVLLASDGAMSATGVKILTSASNPFTAAMVGATIAVATAGNAAGTVALYTTIASFQSAGQVTLAAGSVKTTAVSAAAMTLTESYLNGGAAATPGGVDFVIIFEVDINATRLDVVTTGAGTSIMDLEISGTT